MTTPAQSLQQGITSDQLTAVTQSEETTELKGTFASNELPTAARFGEPSSALLLSLLAELDGSPAAAEPAA